MAITDSPGASMRSFSVDLTVKKIHFNSLNQGTDHKKWCLGMLNLAGRIER